MQCCEKMEMPIPPQKQKPIRGESSRSKKTKENNARQWQNNEEMCRDFNRACLSEIAKKGYMGTSLHTNSWSVIREALASKYSLVFDTVFDKQKFVKNRWDQLKKKYSAWRYLYNQTGNPFDEKTQMFDFSDEQWIYFIKRNKDCKQFRTKRLKYRDEMYNMFEGVIATGESGGSAASATSAAPKTTSKQCSSGTSKRKRVESQDTMSNVFENMCVVMTRTLEEQRQASRSATQSGSTQPDEGEESSIVRCLEFMEHSRDLLEVDDETLGKAINTLTKKVEARKQFLLLQTHGQRTLFLKGVSYDS